MKQWYGVVETVGGILKLLLVIGGSLAMYVLHGKGMCDRTRYTCICLTSEIAKISSNLDGGFFQNDTRRMTTQPPTW